MSKSDSEARSEREPVLKDSFAILLDMLDAIDDIWERIDLLHAMMDVSFEEWEPKPACRPVHERNFRFGMYALSNHIISELFDIKLSLDKLIYKFVTDKPSSIKGVKLTK